MARQRLPAQIRAWIASRQDTLPVLVLVNEHFGIKESQFPNVARKYWPDLRYSSRYLPDIDKINKYQADKRRIIVTTPTLDMMIRKSMFSGIPNEDIEYIASKLLVVNYQNFYSENDLEKQFEKTFKEFDGVNISVLPYSRNFIEYANVFKGPEYFIELAIANCESKENWPVYERYGKCYINVDMFIERFKEMFGFDIPFENVEVKRWIWSRSQTSSWVPYIGAKKYRVFTKWRPSSLATNE